MRREKVRRDTCNITKRNVKPVIDVQLTKSESGLADSDASRSREMTAINSGVQEVPAGVRLPLQTASYASGAGGGGAGGAAAVLVYSAGALQLEEERGGLAAVLARLHADDATLSISLQDADMLLGSGTLHAAGNSGNSATFDLFDSESGQDLTLSPQTFTSSTEAFINDNSDSLGVPGDTDTVGSTEDAKGAADSSKLAVKKPRPKASSPNRQGPQQCQVCGKVFGNASALAKHKLTHSDERKYVCSMCGKAFKRQDHLNGHMLTHRNKKPYECKAEGCGKSYCDARSLRRHTENHHTNNNNNNNNNNNTGSGGGGGSSSSSSSSNNNSSSGGGEASPASSCIQYAPPPTATSQLQQLLAAEPASSSTSTKASSNEGLTKQQLELIQQIMQQTQAATQKQLAKAPAPKAPAAASSKTRTWALQSPAAKAVAAPPGKPTAAADPKPVECNLCHRKFKNIPALNGHMRLHGGYFKKDSESKKCEKKEVCGPPLQTASISVRALIEEKIIQKRITNPQLTITSQSQTTTSATSSPNSEPATPSSTRASAPPQYPSTPPTTVTAKESESTMKVSSFVVPAPPPTAAEKLRRHSDSDDVQEAVALAELLLKRSTKATVKRASSDPGPQQQQQQLQLSFQTDSYALAYQPEDGNFFSDDVFQQVSVQDTMLLHGVDTAQLAESIQFQAESLLQDQTTAEQLQDIESLEDYQSATSVQSPGVGQYQSQSAHSVHSDLQAVLNSPLPVSLADFSTYGQQAAGSPIPKDLTVGYQSTHSPLQHSQAKDFVSYTNSPLTTHSPLPSPLTHHDSPSFTYPTPPASQEGQSPSFGHGTLVTSTLPLASPHASQQATDSFVQSVISHGGHVPPVSSPLSAAFYSSTMSSSAAVEAALSEVLPVETMGDSQGCLSGSLRSHSLGLYQSLVNPSPPPHSPLSTTPVPSPLSLSSVPASSSSVSSPIPQSAFTPTQGQVTFPLSPHHMLQSQMMPNSEDPLLSSSPKDFGSRKKFDFGLQSFKVIGNGLVDFGVPNSGVTGIVVDNNGELKFLQTTNHQQQAKNIVFSGNSLTNSLGMNVAVIGSGNMLHRKSDIDVNKVLGKVSSKGCAAMSPLAIHDNSNYNPCSNGGISRNQRPRLHVPLDSFKDEIDDDVFLSPSSIPASPVRINRKRLRPDPLYLAANAHSPFQSRLRAPKKRESSTRGTPPPYTPPPILSPARNGQGLYWQAASAGSPAVWPSSTTIHGKREAPSSEDGHHNSDGIPECDAQPHINVGPEFQCNIPQWNPDHEKAKQEPSKEHLLWDPGISKVCTETEIEMYLEFACCASVPGGGHNKEYALHLLNMCRGNIHEAMLKLMQPTPLLPAGHPLLAHECTESDRWSADEMETFHQGLLKYDKDFRSIAQEIGSKTVKQCIQFYYMWKKVCPEDYKRLRLIRRQTADFNGRLDLDFEDIRTDDSQHSIPANDVDLVSTSSESRLFVCEYSDCSASFNSRAALNGHIRIHTGAVCGRSPTPDKRPSTATPPSLGDILEEFPCKICGKVFNKVKSRSAHMKSHRPPDAEPKKPKGDSHKTDSGEGRTVSSSGHSASARHNLQ